MDQMKFSKILDLNLKYYGFSTMQLMEAAGLGIARKINAKNKSIGIFCGPGNNGGDGIVAARYLLDKNKVTVYLVGRPEMLKTKEARDNWTILRNTAKIYENLEIKIISDSSEIQTLRKKVSSHNILIDAMLGVGINGELREPFASLIRFFNSIRSKTMLKVSVDVPSGFGTKLCANSSCIISMHIPKVNSKKFKCSVIDIGVPHNFDYVTGPGNVIFLNERNANSRKGDNGRVLVVAGSDTYHGAAIYSALSASKFADLVYVATPKKNISIIKKSSPEFIVSSLEEFDFSKKSLQEFDSVLVGPGLEINDTNKGIVSKILLAGVKTVLDASALNLLEINGLHANCIITPHQGEFAKLFGLFDSEERLRVIARKCGCTIVLKGRIDLICNGGQVYKNFSGNSKMTTGGTGDVLAGVICGLLANNSCFESALAGVFLCGFAGDIIQNQPFSASDVVKSIPLAVESIKRFK